MAKLHLKLRKLREEQQLSQAELAKILSCSQQTYSRYESHTTEIPLESLILLAEFYQTSTDYLLGVTNWQESYPRNNGKWPSKNPTERKH